MIRLVVAEKPSVARDLARVLGARGRAEGHLVGDGLWITWCVGHLVELCEPHEHDPAWRNWSASTLPMLPDPFRLRPIKSNAKQLRVVERLLRSREVGEVVNACDAGREGELIFRLVAEHARCTKPVRRLWLSSLTDQAVREAFAAIRPAGAYDHLGDAARCRSEADWLVGLNATRALTLRGRAGGSGELYTVGRVQTPTLAMIVRRDAEIDAFVPEAFWQVRARLAARGRAGEWDALWHRGKVDRLPTPEEAEAIAGAVRGQGGVVTAVERKTVRERPPLLFDLTLLQREANRRFGMSASATLDAAQALYERHKLLTYPRTDSNHLTRDMVPKLPGIVEGLAGVYGEHCARLLAGPLPVTRRVVDDAEVGDHHAIIPTGKAPALDALPPAERRVFDLVARRFLAAFHPDAVFAAARVEVDIAGHAFGARGRVMVEAGWRAVEPPPQRRARQDGGGDGEPEAALPPVEVGDPVTALTAEARRGETQPPKRHSDASLLGAMERAGQDLDEEELRRAMKESGLGTPATRAAIIEGLIRRSFVRREGKDLVSTPTGRALVAAVPVEALKSAALTGTWERRLADVAAGRATRVAFMEGVRALTRDIVGAILQAAPPEVVGGAPSAEPLGRCPVCGTGVREGPRTYACEGGRACTFVIYKTVAGRKVSPALVQVLLSRGESRELPGFRSKAGKRFPARLALDERGRVELRFGGGGGGDGDGERAPRSARTGGRASVKAPARPPAKAPAPAGEAPARRAAKAPATRAPKPPAPCPSCAAGTIIRGRRGWGCSRWREGCGFVVWFDQAGVTVPDGEADRLFREGRTRLMDLVEPSGAPLRARLVLDLAADGNVRIEPSRRKR